MTSALVGLSLLLWFFGFAMLTQATQGVGAVAMACLIAILARVAQAGEQHRAVMKALAARDVPTAPPTVAEP